MRSFLAALALMLLIFTALVHSSKSLTAEAGKSLCDAGNGITNAIALVEKIQALVILVQGKDELQKTLKSALEKSATLVGSCADATKADLDAKGPIDRFNQQLTAWKTCADSYRQECIKDDVTKARAYRVQVKSAYYGIADGIRARVGQVCDARAGIEDACDKPTNTPSNADTAVTTRSCTFSVGPALCPGGRDPTGQNEAAGPRERQSVLLVEYCCGPACKSTGAGMTTIPFGRGADRKVSCNPYDFFATTCMTAVEKCGPIPTVK